MTLISPKNLWISISIFIKKLGGKKPQNNLCSRQSIVGGLTPKTPRSQAPAYNFEIPALLCTNLGYQEKKNLKYVPVFLQ